MRLLLVLSIAGWVCLSNATSVQGQAIREPGQLGASFQVQQADGIAAYSAAIAPKTTVATVDDSHDRLMNRLWVASMISAVAGTSLDAASSWGLTEGNGLLASSNGQFGAKGLALKAGLATAMLVPQICLRKHQDVRRAFTIANFAQGAIFTGISVHNFQLRNTH